jgi:hypothetical protein
MSSFRKSKLDKAQDHRTVMSVRSSRKTNTNSQSMRDCCFELIMATIANSDKLMLLFGVSASKYKLWNRLRTFPGTLGACLAHDLAAARAMALKHESQIEASA